MKQNYKYLTGLFTLCVWWIFNCQRTKEFGDWRFYIFYIIKYKCIIYLQTIICPLPHAIIFLFICCVQKLWTRSTYRYHVAQPLGHNRSLGKWSQLMVPRGCKIDPKYSENDYNVTNYIQFKITIISVINEIRTF